MAGFDILIVGAGSSGAVLASRLSEDPACRVGVVEAGGWPDDPEIAAPDRWPLLQGRSYDWAFRTVPQAGTADRVHPWPRGRIVGGSSCLHAMAHVRGHPEDFEPWAEATGSRRWSYEGLLPAFRRSEAFSLGAEPLRGGSGPMPVLLPSEDVSPLVRSYMAAGQAIGAPALRDHNGPTLNGTAPNSLTIRAGKRVSAADAYLTASVLGRPNLTLVTGFEVERLLFDKSRATGVEGVQDSQPTAVLADRVILAAGAVASPLLLMRSGVGDPEVLAAAGVRCRLDRRAVGRNLHDHLLAAGNLYRARRPVPPSRLQHSESLMYLNGDDPAEPQAPPDVVLACVVAPAVSEQFAAPPLGEAFTLLFGVTHPTSRGYLAITGPSRTDPPIIDPAYLSSEHDRRTFRKAFLLARAVGHAAPLDAWRDTELLPGPSVFDAAATDAFVGRAAITHHHPVGTCRMGQDAEAVVDGSLRVNGAENLHVVDASVIPTIPSGPIHASVLAIAEQFATIRLDGERSLLAPVT